MWQLLKRFLCYGLLVFGLQTTWAYSLLGPTAGYLPAPPGNFGDVWEAEVIGFNPIPATAGAPPRLGADPLGIGPKNIGEEYRRNTPVIYYSFDQNFNDFFGADGEQAVDGAMAMLNNAFTNSPNQQIGYLTNGVDSCSSNLMEYPLQTKSQNYNLMSVELKDLKSVTLALMMEQLGLADAIRYTWVLHNRYQIPGANPPCPANMDYLVVLRNFDFIASPLNQLQYSAYINGGLYTYYIPVDLCDNTPAPPDTDAMELAVDPLVKNEPVASGGQMAEGSLENGFFYTGLTRDDMAGLRYLYSSANINVDTVASNSVALSGGGTTNLNDAFLLGTSNLTVFTLTAQTNGPVALQALYPGLVITSVTTNFISGTYTYTFGNVVTNTYSTNTAFQYQIQTITIAPQIGAPAGSPPVVTTNIQSITIVSNTGDFYLLPTNLCGLEVLSNYTTIVTTNRYTFGSFTNTSGANTTNIISTNLVFKSTNYVLAVAPCEFISGSSTTGKHEGIEKIQFVRIPDQDIDPLTGNFVHPVTNNYTIMVVPPDSSQATAQTFRRVLTRPDVLFSAADLLPGPSAINDLVAQYSRTINFNMNNMLPGLAGPGTIDPSSTITFNKVGPVLENLSPSFLSEKNAGLDAFIWGSFDGSTNNPIVYPNGTSIATLENEALIQISPDTLPDATNGTPYSITLAVAGGQPPYTWLLAANSASLPVGLNLSSGGVISGIPTANPTGTYDFTVQMNDSSARSVQRPYSITIH